MSPLVFGTIVMLFFSITAIVFMVYIGNQFKAQKRYNKSRDEFYINRLNEIESILKNELIELIGKIKIK
jgi:hypothetical protein